MKNITDEIITAQWFEYLHIKGKLFGYGTFNLLWKGKNVPELAEINPISICKDFSSLNGNNKIPLNILKELYQDNTID